MGWPGGAAWVCLLLAACTAPAGLADYPRRQIERPYTLPDDVNTWSTVTTPLGYTGPGSSASGVDEPDTPLPESDEEGTFSWPIPLPIFYEFSLTDRVTLEGAGLPLGLRVQLAHTDRHLIGARAFVLGFGYLSDHGVVVAQVSSLFHRYRLGEHWALESTAGVQTVLRSRTGADADALLEVGPRVQLGDRVSLRPRAGLVFDVDAPQLAIPLGLGVIWSLHCRWDLSGSYTARSKALGYGRESHLASFDAKLYW